MDHGMFHGMPCTSWNFHGLPWNVPPKSTILMKMNAFSNDDATYEFLQINIEVEKNAFFQSTSGLQKTARESLLCCDIWR